MCVCVCFFYGKFYSWTMWKLVEWQKKKCVDKKFSTFKRDHTNWNIKKKKIKKKYGLL